VEQRHLVPFFLVQKEWIHTLMCCSYSYLHISDEKKSFPYIYWTRGARPLQALITAQYSFLFLILLS